MRIECYVVNDKNMPSILFVCTANRFRSPLAAAILKKALSVTGGVSLDSQIPSDMEDWQVDSAGTWATSGEPVLPMVVDAAKTLDIDLADHRSERIDAQLLSEYDLILTMQASHKEALQFEFPSHAGRIFLFSYVVERGSYDIPDSVNSGQEIMNIAREINVLIQTGLCRIYMLAMALHNERY